MNPSTLAPTKTDTVIERSSSLCGAWWKNLGRSHLEDERRNRFHTKKFCADGPVVPIKSIEPVGKVILGDVDQQDGATDSMPLDAFQEDPKFLRLGQSVRKASFMPLYLNFLNVSRLFQPSIVRAKRLHIGFVLVAILFQNHVDWNPSGADVGEAWRRITLGGDRSSLAPIVFKFGARLGQHKSQKCLNLHNYGQLFQTILDFTRFSGNHLNHGRSPRLPFSLYPSLNPQDSIS